MIIIAILQRALCAQWRMCFLYLFFWGDAAPPVATGVGYSYRVLVLYLLSLFILWSPLRNVNVHHRHVQNQLGSIRCGKEPKVQWVSCHFILIMSEITFKMGCRFGTNEVGRTCYNVCNLIHSTTYCCGGELLSTLMKRVCIEDKLVLYCAISVKTNKQNTNDSFQDLRHYHFTKPMFAICSYTR